MHLTLILDYTLNHDYNVHDDYTFIMTKLLIIYCLR